MVKGINKRVVVLKAPDTELFEEAIFLIRDDALKKGVTKAELLREAQRVAGGKGECKPAGFFKRWRLPLAAAAGAGLTGLLWIISAVLF